MVKLRGHFDGTRVLLDEPAPPQLVPGTPVEVVLTGCLDHPDDSRDSFFDELGRLTGTVEGPADWSEEHDHYAHGAPKRAPRNG